MAGTGCDRLKAFAGMGGADAGEAGTAASSGGLGGVLSLLGNDFEGEITMAAKSKKEAGLPSTLVFGIKRPKYRVDTSGMNAKSAAMFQGASLIIDLPAKKGYALIAAQKKAIVFDFEKMKDMPLPALPGMPKVPGAPTAMPDAPPAVDKTGRKDVVAGTSCEIWNVTSKGRRAELCVAEGITWVDLTSVGIASPELTLAAVASEANRFPLRVISFDEKGQEELRLEATKIEKRALEDARFQVPADFQVTDLAAMMGAFTGPAASARRPLPKR